MYLLITGSKIKGYLYLRRLCKDIGIEPVKANILPIDLGNLKIVKIEVEEKL